MTSSASLYVNWRLGVGEGVERIPQWGPGTEPLVGGQGEALRRKLPEAESFWSVFIKSDQK